ncbi:MAG: PilZ domain-containing protein [Oligoflexia bacterium]|nr:PilZ domain-containing protein [Oligoflexia bacterium]
MSKKTWHVHMSGQTLGPLTTEAVKTMLSQMRLHFVDYIWTQGFTKWLRINEVDDFMSLMPSYPQESIPSVAKESKDMAEEEVVVPLKPKKALAPKTTSKSSPKASPAPTLKPAPEPIEEEALEPEPPAPPPVPAKKVWPKERRTIRVKLEGGVNISKIGEYVLVDISEGGVFVKAQKNLEIGTEVKFSLRSNLTKEVLHLTGVVIRHGISHNEQGFAIEFTRLNPSYKRLIKQYVAQFNVE